MEYDCEGISVSEKVQLLFSKIEYVVSQNFDNLTARKNVIKRKVPKNVRKL